MTTDPKPLHERLREQVDAPTGGFTHAARLMLEAATALEEQAAARPEPDGTLHDDGCFTWKPGKTPPERKDHRVGWRADFYLATPAAAQAARPKRELSASERLHNICDALHEQAAESPFTREEWDRVDAEIVRLQNRVKELEAAAAQGVQPATWRVIAAEILTVVDELARRGEMFPQNADYHRENKAAFRRVAEVLEWFDGRGHAPKLYADAIPCLNPRCREGDTPQCEACARYFGALRAVLHDELDKADAREYGRAIEREVRGEGE